MLRRQIQKNIEIWRHGYYGIPALVSGDPLYRGQGNSARSMMQTGSRPDTGLGIIPSISPPHHLGQHFTFSLLKTEEAWEHSPCTFVIITLSLQN